MLCKWSVLASLFCVVNHLNKSVIAGHLRIIDGKEDKDNEFPYVVTLEKALAYGPRRNLYRYCSGTLIAATWVLTAGHCLPRGSVIAPALNYDMIRFGNMTVARNATNSFRRILKTIQHPNCEAFTNDIGLVLVEEVPISFFPKLSGMDYQALAGLPVHYAGYGVIRPGLYYEYAEEVANSSLQLGEGIAVICPRHIRKKHYPGICVVPKCSRKTNTACYGDSGGPVFWNGKIIGVVSSGDPLPPMPIKWTIIVTISPYTQWIRDNIDSSVKHVPSKYK